MRTSRARCYTRAMEALVYDVHGNLPALEAVLDDAHGATSFVLGGDYALFGGWPKETIERLSALPDALWIRGNGERWTADPQAAPANPIVPAARSKPPEKRSGQRSWPTSPRCRRTPPATPR